MSIGLNILSVPDKQKLFTFARACNLQAANVLNNPDLCRELKDALPSCEVTFRLKGGPWGDDDGEGILKVTAEEYVREMVAQLKGDKRIRVGAGNEMPLNARTVARLCELVPIANREGVSLDLLHIATGNPQPPKLDKFTGAIITETEWEIAKPLLDLLAVHRQHRLAIHEYAGGVVTSGLIGGNPTMISPGEWPAIAPFTRWHLGRFQFLIEYCQRRNIKPPRMIVTEHGFDDTSDIKPYLDTLQKTAPYTSIRGWRSLVNQWASWWPMWNAEKAYAEQLKWADSVLYRGTPVEAQCIFAWGDSGGWAQFDVSGATELQSLLVAYSKEQATVSTTPLPNDERWQETENLSGNRYRVRLQPRVDDQQERAWIDAGAKFWYIRRNVGDGFLFTKTVGGLIGFSDEGVLTVQPEPPELPAPKPPPFDLRQHLTAIDALLAMAQRERHPLVDELSSVQHKLATLDTRIRLLEVMRDDIAPLIDPDLLAA